MYIKSFIYFLLFIPCVLYSQSFTTSGFVYDDVSEETLLDVYVYCPQTGMGTTTNNYGYYTISLPAGYYNLLFIKEGFIAKMDTIKTNRNQLLNIWLEKKMDGIEYPINPFEKKLVKLDSNKFGNFIFKNNAQTKQQIKLALERNTQIIDRTESSLLNIPGNQSSQMPNFLGETDVIRTLKQLPGVMPGSEIFNGLYIRGGAMDQNLLLLEGVPIYNVDHAFGLFSSINPDGIKNIHLTKGNFNAKQGGRLSAETDLVLKDGSSDKFNGLFTYIPFTV